MNTSTQPGDPSRADEYKAVKARQETHEKRYYDLLLYAATGFVAILGLSDKLPIAIVPIMIGILLVFCTEMAVSNSIHQRYAAAYLLEFFDKQIAHLNYEKAYEALFSSQAVTPPPPTRVLRALNTLKNPFGLLNVGYFGVSLYFIHRLVLDVTLLFSIEFLAIYVAFISMFHLQIFRSIARLQQNTVQYYKAELASWRERELPSKTSIAA